MSQDPVFGLSQRLPPSNIQAEQSLLGAILANNRALERCPGLEPEHFADPVHGRLFQVCQKIVQAGGVADGVTLKNRLEHSGILDEVGGTAYLAQLLSAMVGIINAGEYAAAVREAWVRRQVIDISAQAINCAFGTDPDLDPATIVTDAVDQMMKVSEVADLQAAGTWADAVDAAVDGSEEAAHAGEGHCLLTGIATLDSLWGGFWPGFLDLLGARLGQGKTGLAMQIAEHVARGLPEGQAVQIFSLDMSREDLAVRMLASATGIPSDSIRRGKVSMAEGEALVLARKDLRGLPLLVPDKAGMTLSEVCMGARIAVKRKGAVLVIVDHMIRIRPDKSMRNMSRTEQVDLIAWTLKELAKELGVPVLALTQLSRMTDRREGAGSQRPQISDMMYGGESHADNIALLWREETYLGAKPPEPPARLKAETKAEMSAEWWKKKEALANKAEVILAKRRFGQVGAVMLDFDGPRTRFGIVRDGSTRDMWQPPPADSVMPEWVTE